MKNKPKTYLQDLHLMSSVQINQAAVNVLEDLLERCTLNLVCDLTGISRTTLYKWLDPDVSLDEMNHRDAAWLIMLAETSPKVQLLMQRGPLSKPRMARRMLEEGKNHEDA